MKILILFAILLAISFAHTPRDTILNTPVEGAEF